MEDQLPFYNCDSSSLSKAPAPGAALVRSSGSSEPHSTELHCLYMIKVLFYVYDYM